MANYCANHPNIQSQETCTTCQKLCCDNCWVSPRGAIICHACAARSRKLGRAFAGAAALLGASAAAFVGYKALERPPIRATKTPRMEPALVQQFVGATAGIQGLALSLDKKWLASAGDDGSVRLWSAESGAAAGVLRGAKKRLRAVTFAGDLVVAAGDDKLLYIWRRDQEEPLAALEKHASPIYDVLALPGSSQVVTAGADGQLLLWDVEKKVFVKQIITEERGLRALALSPAGDRFVVVGLRTQYDINQETNNRDLYYYSSGVWTNAATTKIFDTQTLTELASLPVDEPALRAVAFSPDGTKLALVGLSKGIHEINLTTKEDKIISPIRTATKLAYDDQGTLFATTESGEIYAWKDGVLSVPYSSPTRQPLRAMTLSGGQLFFAGEASLISRAAAQPAGLDAKDFVSAAHPGIANDLAFVKDGQLVVAGPSGSTQFQWSPGREPLVVARYATSNALSVSASRDGSHLAFVGDCAQGCKVEVRQGLLAPAAAQAMKTLQEAKLNAEDFSDQACFFVRAQAAQTEPLLGLLDDLDMPRYVSLKTQDEVTVAVFTPQQRDVDLFAKTLDEAIKAEELSAAKLTEGCHSIRVLGADTDRADTLLTQLSISGDPSLRYSGAAVFNTNDPNGLLLASRKGRVSDIAFSPNELNVAISSLSSELRLFHAGSAASLWRFDGPDKGITTIAYSPSGDILAAGHTSGEVVLWDTASHQKLRSLFAVEGSATEPSSISFSPDGKSVVITNLGAGMFRFDVESGELRDTYRGFFEPIKAAAYSPDGKLIAAASQLGKVLIYRAAGGEVLTEFKPAEIISALAFGADQRLYIAGAGSAPNRDSSIMIWSLQ